jgi:hypothetical protein
VGSPGLTGCALLDQGLEIGFDAGSVLRGVAQQRLDEALLAEPEVSREASARQPVQKPEGLFCEQLFEFVGRHGMLVIGQRSMVSRIRLVWNDR